jgi:Fe-S-cluster-containing hydrogenase component 2
VPEDVAVVDSARCLGCGVCTLACPAGAIRLERLPSEEVLLPPANIQEWMLLRAQARGLKIEEVL